MGFGHRAPTHKLSAAQHRSERPACCPGRFCPATVTGAGFSVSRPRPLPAHTPRGNGCQERRRLREREAPGTLLRRRQRQAWARRPPSSGAAASGLEPHLGRQPPGPPVASTITSLACGGRGEGGGRRCVTGGGRAQQVVVGVRGGVRSMVRGAGALRPALPFPAQLLRPSPAVRGTGVTTLAWGHESRRARCGQARSLTHYCGFSAAHRWRVAGSRGTGREQTGPLFFLSPLTSSF